MKQTEKKLTKENLPFEDFMSAFREKLDEKYSQFIGGFTLKEDIIVKNSVEMHGIIARAEGRNIAPVFYYEDFYNSYSSGTSIDECIVQLISYLMKHELPENDFGKRISEWSLAKKNLIIKLVNSARNSKMLRQVPHMCVGDMAVITQIHIKHQAVGSCTVTVDRDLVNLWGIDEKTVFDAAFNNMRKMEILLEDLRNFADPDGEIPDEAPVIYVLRFKDEIFGAPAILNTDKLLEFAVKEEKDFYVMPVSIHEALMIEYVEDISKEFLFEMLNSINQDHPVRDDVLSFEVFLLKRESREMTYVSDGRKLCIYN